MLSAGPGRKINDERSPHYSDYTFSEEKDGRIYII